MSGSNQKERAVTRCRHSDGADSSMYRCVSDLIRRGAKWADQTLHFANHTLPRRRPVHTSDLFVHSMNTTGCVYMWAAWGLVHVVVQGTCILWLVLSIDIRKAELVDLIIIWFMKWFRMLSQYWGWEAQMRALKACRQLLTSEGYFKVTCSLKRYQ